MACHRGLRVTWVHRSRPRGHPLELRHVRGRMILDHVNIGVADLAASRAFSERALAPLGITFVMANQAGIGFGRGGKPEFWISERALLLGTHRVRRRGPRHRRSRSFRSYRGGWSRQRGSWSPVAVPPVLLRRVRTRPGRQQHRGGDPHRGLSSRFSGRGGSRAASGPPSRSRYARGTSDRSRRRVRSSTARVPSAVRIAWEGA